MLQNSLTEATVVIILQRIKLLYNVENPKNKTAVFQKKKQNSFVNFVFKNIKPKLLCFRSHSFAKNTQNFVFLYFKLKL